MKIFIATSTLILAFFFLESCTHTTNQAPNSLESPTFTAQGTERAFGNDDSFNRFLQLCQLGRPIPNDLIYQFTMLSNPMGHFYAADIRPIQTGLEGIILVQQTQACERFFLLTTNGAKIIDQVLVAENCPNQLGTTPSTYMWQGTNRIVQAFKKSVSRVEDLPRTVYQIQDSGSIVVVATTDR